VDRERLREIEAFQKNGGIYSPSGSGRKAGSYWKPAKRDEAQELLLDGKSVRQTMALTNLAKNTVLSIRKTLLAEMKSVYCGCGLPVDHRGWCSVRYAASPVRQAFMSTLIPKAAPCHSLRPGAFFLGFLFNSSLHWQNVPQQRHCESKACPFPAIYFGEDSHLCRYHANFFVYSLSMTDSRLGWEDLHDSEDEDATLSVVQPWNDPIIFEHKGKRVYDGASEQTQ
jgi:hypothetical protein